MVYTVNDTEPLTQAIGGSLTNLLNIKKINSFNETVIIHYNREGGPPSIALNLFLSVLYGCIISSLCVFCCGITCLRETPCGLVDDDYEGGGGDEQIILSNRVFNAHKMEEQLLDKEDQEDI